MTSRPTRVAVVDHGAGNLVSVSQALTRCGAEVDVVSRPTQLDSYDGIVLPGVGATRTVMKGIEDGGFTIPLQTTSRPLLGICVGMQVLFDMSEEDDAPCLGIVGGRVRRLESAPSLPHIGWNDLELVGEDPLFEGLADPVVYFVHSYAPTPTHPRRGDRRIRARSQIRRCDSTGKRRRCSVPPGTLGIRRAADAEPVRGNVQAKSRRCCVSGSSRVSTSPEGGW